MIKFFRRAWKYTWAFLSGKLDEVSDEKVQLHQAVEARKAKVKELTNAGANVVANAKMTAAQLQREQAQLDSLTQQTQEALRLQASADPEKALRYEQAAISLAQAMELQEREVAELASTLVQQEAESAAIKKQVRSIQLELQKTIAEKGFLLSRLDRAKADEAYNSARDAFSQVDTELSGDVPGFAEVRDKIERRAAKASAMGELIDQSPGAERYEIQSAVADSNAQALLARMRVEMGLTSQPALPAEDAIVDAVVIPDSPEAIEIPAEEG